MMQILYKLLCLLLALFLLAGCGKITEPSAPGESSSSVEGTMRPTESPPEASAKDPLTGNEESKDFSTTYSYTPLGRIGDPEGLAAALGNGNIQVTFQS